MGNNLTDHRALRERFNPDGSPHRRHQLRMLELLVEFDRICRKHSLNYWLCCGTLLGAVRHKGFIPWDDDVDVKMLRPDYDRLMKILPGELPATMALQSQDTDPNYFFFYAKLRDRRSVHDEGNGYDRAWKEHGIYIDIFPCSRHPRFIHRISEATLGHAYKVMRTTTGSDGLAQVRRIVWLNRHIIYPLLRFVSLFCKSGWTFDLGTPFYDSNDEADLLPLGEAEFEGRMFPVPKDCDKLLRGFYGDYMKLPDLDRLQQHTQSVRFID